MNRCTGLMAFGITLLIGCDAAEKNESALTDTKQTALVDGCVASREKTAECRMELVDRWIAVRAKYNPDIAERMATPEKKAELRKVALQEFKQDGAGPLEPRAAVCRQMMGHLPPPAIKLGEQFAACNAKTNCGEFTQCVLPIFEKMEILRTQGSKPQ